MGNGMRWVVLLCLVPCVVHAKDLHIAVEYALKQERIRPEPKITYPHVSQYYTVSEDGSVTETYHTSGKFPEDTGSTSRLGGKLKIIDGRTIRRRWKLGAQTRELTISVEGTACKANLRIDNAAGEFEARSTDLNVMGLYRNTQVQSISCKIE